MKSPSFRGRDGRGCDAWKEWECPRPRASWELRESESPRVWSGRAAGSNSRPRFNCSWTRSIAPAARGEPLGGSETRLKQLACCRQGRGTGKIPDYTLEDQAGTGGRATASSVWLELHCGGGSAGRCAPAACGPAPRFPCARAGPGPARPPQTRAGPIRGRTARAEEVRVAAKETSHGPGFSELSG